MAIRKTVATMTTMIKTVMTVTIKTTATAYMIELKR